MKVNVNYELVLNAIDKLGNGQELTKDETRDLVIILKAAQGDYIPSREELEM